MYYALFRHRINGCQDFLLWTGFETIEEAVDYSNASYITHYLIKVIEVEGGQAG